MKKESTNKSFRYKGWYCYWYPLAQLYYLYTPEEMEQPAGVRGHEWESETADECKQFIDSY